jgi:hypothetical protein
VNLSPSADINTPVYLGGHVHLQVEHVNVGCFNYLSNDNRSRYLQHRFVIEKQVTCRDSEHLASEFEIGQIFL